MRGVGLCGTIRIAINGPVSAASVCHCGPCRKVSGFCFASIDAPERTVWAPGSQVATSATFGGEVRGGCGTRQWSRDMDGATSIEAGLLDQPTGTRLVDHIFMADKGDYYTIADGLPQFEQWGQT